MPHLRMPWCPWWGHQARKRNMIPSGIPEGRVAVICEHGDDRVAEVAVRWRTDVRICEQVLQRRDHIVGDHVRGRIHRQWVEAARRVSEVQQRACPLLLEPRWPLPRRHRPSGRARSPRIALGEGPLRLWRRESWTCPARPFREPRCSACAAQRELTLARGHRVGSRYRRPRAPRSRPPVRRPPPGCRDRAVRGQASTPATHPTIDFDTDMSKCLVSAVMPA